MIKISELPREEQDELDDVIAQLRAIFSDGKNNNSYSCLKDNCKGTNLMLRFYYYLNNTFCVGNLAKVN